jgi:phosphatidate cytidylyltransferase
MAYLGLGSAVVLRMRLAYGMPMLAIFLTAVKFTDIAAYFVGTAVGRHKLIPWLSPGKSWEGLVGGMAAAAGVAALLAWALHIRTMSVPTAACFGLLVGLAGQFGDLCESLLKRSASAKDSGVIIPEFGGVLDVVDSVLFSAPVALIVLALAA